MTSRKLLLFAISAVTFSSTLAQGEENPADAFLQAYQSYQGAEKLENSGEFNPAMDALEKARDLLNEIASRQPRWNPMIVAYRQRKIQEALDRIHSGGGREITDSTLPIVPDLGAASYDDPAEEFLRIYELYQKGKGLEQQGKSGAALDAFEAARDAADDFIAHWPAWNRVIVDYRKGRIGEAIQAICTSGTSFEPDNLVLCEVHNQKMDRQVVAISYGLPASFFRKSTLPTETERKTLFPHRTPVRWGGCVVGPDESKTFSVCPACDAAYEKWHAEHQL